MDIPPQVDTASGKPKGPPPVPAAPQRPAPPTQPGQIGVAPTPDATGGVIPYKNPTALIAYYLGVFGLIPVLGLPLALGAVIMGIVGLRQRALKRAYGGLVHACVGIVLGVVSMGYHGVAILLIGP